jgi:LysM repeat protein
MRFFLICGGLLLGLFGVVGCGAGGGITGSSYNPGYGPFDQKGNYVEAWADKPAKKHRWGKKPATDTPAEAKPTPPKQDTRVASNTPSTPTPALPKSRPAPTVAKVTTPSPRPTYTPTPKPRPKPKPTVVKPKPKPSSSKRHVVGSGDTLYSLSRRYGTSVSAIQRANGLKGTTIVKGKSLVIPN